MREIKFRGKRIDNGEWVYGYYVHQAFTIISGEIKWLHTIYVPNEAGFTDHFIVDPETVGQFVLKDKSGKEIYEGDVVQIASHKMQIQKIKLRGVVIFSWASFGVEIKHVDIWKGFYDHIEPPDNLWFLNLADNKDIEVIGNIYENPELLTD